ncbi:Uncharacterised protein [Candidatus Anstonella stagnisolia]|nr:Uncharacterised protein [Candidatus Anstonella stagnisolia]
MPMEAEEGKGEEAGSVPAEEGKFRGSKPDFRVVQPQVDKEGKQQLVDVGALWRNVSRSGNEFYTLKIGKMKLLVFENKFKD